MFCYISSNAYAVLSLPAEPNGGQHTRTDSSSPAEREKREVALEGRAPVSLALQQGTPCQQSHRGPGNLRDEKHPVWYLAAAYLLYFRLGPGTLLSCTLGHFFLKPIYPQRTRYIVTTTHLGSTAFVSCSVPCADKHSVQMCAINISLA